MTYLPEFHAKNAHYRLPESSKHQISLDFMGFLSDWCSRKENKQYREVVSIMLTTVLYSLVRV